MNRRRMLCASGLALGLDAIERGDGNPPKPTPTGSFWEPIDRQMINWLAPARAHAILDAGCGSGLHLGIFAEVAGSVTGLDAKAASLTVAGERLKAHPDRDKVSLREGDVLRPPFRADSFDLVWASHVLHVLDDPVAGARALAATLRTGGRLALREDGVQTWLLPLDTGVGRPGLEYRAQGAFVEWFVDDRLKRGRVPFGWTEVLRKAGLKDVRPKSFLWELIPPFTADQIASLRRFLQGRLSEALGAEDREALRRLADPDSEFDFAMREDLHFVTVSTVYLGRV